MKPRDNPAEDFSRLTMAELVARFDQVRKRIMEEDAQGHPLDGWFNEGNRILAAMDALMEQFKGTKFYDDYWRSRQIKGELPEVPPSFDPSRQ